MRASILSPLIAILTLASCQQMAATPRDESEDVREIGEHIDSIFRAYMAGDLERIRATHSEDWCGYLAESRRAMRNLEEYMARASETVLARRPRFHAYEFVEREIRVHGDTAVVPYVAKLTIDLPNGETVHPMIRAVDVYARRDGEWIQIASNVNQHPDTVDELHSYPSPVPPSMRKAILTARDRVWRSYFANDRESLGELLPSETTVLDASGGFSRLEDILSRSASFAESGGELRRIEFPETEIQLFGNVAMLYTTYEMELEVAGKRHVERGTGTEIFVLRDGRWVNPGWHLARHATGG